MYRNHTKTVQIGDRVIGGGNPVLIQSMTNTPTEDVQATVAQILRLEEAGCEIVRCTVPTLEAAKAIAEIKNIVIAMSIIFRFLLKNPFSMSFIFIILDDLIFEHASHDSKT